MVLLPLMLQHPGLLAVTTIVLIIIGWIRYVKAHYDVFARLGLPGPKPMFLMGNALDFAKRFPLDLYAQWSKQYGAIFGYYEGMRPSMVVTCPRLAHEILAKQFRSFSARPQHTPFLWEPEERSLQNSNGSLWKHQRKAVSGGMSGRCIREVFPKVQEITENLLVRLDTMVAEFPDGFRIDSLMECYSVDVMAQAALGYHSNALADEDDPLRKYMQVVHESASPDSFASGLARLFPILTSLLKPLDKDHKFWAQRMREDVQVFVTRIKKNPSDSCPIMRSLCSYSISPRHEDNHININSNNHHSAATDNSDNNASINRGNNLNKTESRSNNSSNASDKYSSIKNVFPNSRVTPSHNYETGGRSTTRHNRNISKSRTSDTVSTVNGRFGSSPPSSEQNTCLSSNETQEEAENPTQREAVSADRVTVSKRTEAALSSSVLNEASESRQRIEENTTKPSDQNEAYKSPHHDLGGAGLADQGHEVKVDEILKDQGQGERSMLNEEEVTAEVMGLLAAGLGPLAMALTFVFYCLAVYEEDRAKVMEEIEEVMGGKEEITLDQLLKMKALERFIFESMRKFPVAPGVSRECVADCVISGYKFTRGMVIRIMSGVMYAAESIFPQPEHFLSERFKVKKPSLAWMPFGQGPRKCVADRLALVILKLCSASVLQRFQVHTARDTQIPLKVALRPFLVPKDGVWVKFVKK